MTDRKAFDPVANAQAHRCVHGHAPPCLLCVLVGRQAAILRQAFANVGKSGPCAQNDTIRDLAAQMGLSEAEARAMVERAEAA